MSETETLTWNRHLLFSFYPTPPRHRSTGGPFVAAPPQKRLCDCHMESRSNGDGKEGKNSGGAEYCAADKGRESNFTSD
ncbi:hypothetical protein JKG47_22635 [Acidithiobacillus sp. MC6.1]|nr:hypothetical protein [Acidithiobacillus sp. MC6.1]